MARLTIAGVFVLVLRDLIFKLIDWKIGVDEIRMYRRDNIFLLRKGERKYEIFRSCVIKILYNLQVIHILFTLIYILRFLIPNCLR